MFFFPCSLGLRGQSRVIPKRRLDDLTKKREVHARIIISAGKREKCLHHHGPLATSLCMLHNRDPVTITLFLVKAFWYIWIGGFPV